MTPNSPEDLFRAEKERSQSERGSIHAKLLAEAKAAFDKLMAEGQAARKSGRPRKNPLPLIIAAVAVEPTATLPRKVPAKSAKKPAAKKVGATGSKKSAKPAKKAVKKSAQKKPAKKPVAKAKKPAKHSKRR